MIQLMLFMLSMLLLQEEESEEEEEAEEAEEAEEGQEGQEEAEEEEEEDEPTRNPKARIKSLIAANDRLSMKLRRSEKRIEVLEEGSSGSDDGQLKDARMQIGFLQTVLTYDRKLDVETAWDLGHVRGFFDAVSISDDGDVSGMEQALDKLLARYPWLEDVDSIPPSATPEKPSGRKVGGTKKADKGATLPSQAALEKRLPALGRHKSR